MWADALPPGITIEEGVEVHRYPVGPRNHDQWSALHAEIARGQRVDYADELLWMANSVWAQGILDAVGGSQAGDWTIAMPYLFGTTFWTVVARPTRSIVFPCLHDEAHARARVVRTALASSRGLFFNSTGERDLARTIIGSLPTRCGDISACPVIGVGYEERPIPSTDEVRAFTSRHGLTPGYLLYAGRREIGKGVPDLYRAYRAYRQATDRPRPLVLVGSGELPVPDDLIPHVVDLGFVDHTDMAVAYAGAFLLVHPSRMESLGLVLLEAWLAGTPVLVTAHSPVLVEHCTASGGGLWWANPAEFAEAVLMLEESPNTHDHLAIAGREYVMERFRWAAVGEHLIDSIAALA